MGKTRRDTSQRRDRIARMLRENGCVQVSDLSERFDVSGVTIRKDLFFLEKHGIATRSYGGAILADSGVYALESSFDRKQQLYSSEKSGIGKAAAELIQDGDSIILDAGSTTLQLANNLVGKQNLTVVTNSHNIINALIPFDHIEVMSLGGTLRRKSHSFYGSAAEYTLKNLHVDKLFLGVDGLHMERGCTTHFEAEAEINRLMCAVASEVIVVTDSSKFGSICLHKIMEPSQISCVVTDSKIPQDYLEGLRRLGIKVIIVDA